MKKGLDRPLSKSYISLYGWDISFVFSGLKSRPSRVYPSAALENLPMIIPTAPILGYVVLRPDQTPLTSISLIKYTLS